MAIKQESVKLSISDDCNGHDGDVEIKNNDNKQLLDEVEHDIMNYQNRGLCYLPKPKAEADNTDTRKRRHSSVEKWLYFKTKVKVTLISLTKII